MTQTMRLPEKWFRRGLWLLALLFAGFLIGLGGALVGDLPKIESRRQLADFTDRALVRRLEGQMAQARTQQKEAQEALAQAQLGQQAATAELRAARQGLESWLAARQATQRQDQDPEVLGRTRRLDPLQQALREAEATVQSRRQELLDAQQREAGLRRDLEQHEEAAGKALAAEQRHLELRVFLYRLALTLPLLGVAGLLLWRHRQGRWWPFVWGFALFAAFTFFVELVPYLPSYGVYVRYAVGVLLTVIIGRQAIVSLERYLQRQRQAEAQPDSQRRKALPYDAALGRLSQNLCPGCERAANLKDDSGDFCPHCGIGLFDRCGACRTRKSAFAHYCLHCGVAAPVPQASGTGLT